jgi:group I intron endonuclease
MRKYGLENFSFDILEECEIEELNEKEIYYIDYFNSHLEGYNQTLGGSNGYTQEQLMLSMNIKNDLLNTELSYDEMMEKYEISRETISKINNGKTFRDNKLAYPLRLLYGKEHKCKICGKLITKNAEVCIDCGHKEQRVVERPSAEQLLQELKESNFVAVGRKYGVSDNAIRKWCKAYDIPSTAKELREYFNPPKEIKPMNKKVAMINMVTLEIIQIFESTREAARFLGKGNSHITEACNGKIKSAYGYNWKYVEE